MRSHTRPGFHHELSTSRGACRGAEGKAHSSRHALGGAPPGHSHHRTSPGHTHDHWHNRPPRQRQRARAAHRAEERGTSAPEPEQERHGAADVRLLMRTGRRGACKITSIQEVVHIAEARRRDANSTRPQSRWHRAQQALSPPSSARSRSELNTKQPAGCCRVNNRARGIFHCACVVGSRMRITNGLLCVANAGAAHFKTITHLLSCA